MKKIAIITDIHGNLEALTAVINDIKNKNITEIICLGDTINLGPNSKECIDLLIEHNIKSVLGNHEMYLLKGFNNNLSEESKHYNYVKQTLTNKEINYIKACPLYYEIKYKTLKKIILSHYLLNDINDEYPFEQVNLKNDINLWKKYNNENISYIIGHLHISYEINQELENYPNINIVDSLGCTKDEYTSYMVLGISKNISIKKIKVKYNRTKFINKILNLDFPDKQNILKIFYNIK